MQRLIASPDRRDQQQIKNVLKNAGKWQRNNNGHPADNGTIHIVRDIRIPGNTGGDK
jgi:hypothetical protein